MSLPPYPKYKPSGVEWLGDVPEHWQVRRLKQICQIFPSNVDKKSHEDELPIRLCNYTDVYYNDSITEEMEFMAATATAEQVAKFTLRAGDVIITKDSETADDIGIPAYVPFDLPNVVCGYHLSMVRANNGNVGRFVKRLFDGRHLKANFEILANGLTRVGLSQYAIDNVQLAVPPTDEQTQIANFLDHETSKIDALIAEQEKLITLLAEKRQATISQAVTKGLDPTVPMKDSGVEWLGLVPAHWEVCKLGGLCIKIGSGKTPLGGSEVYVDDGVTFIRSQNVYDEGLRLDDVVYISPHIDEEMSSTRIAIGDILLNVTGASIGRTCLVPTDFEGGNVNQHVCIIRLQDALLKNYIALAMKSLSTKSQIDAAQSGAAREGLNFSQIAQLRFALPPCNERIKIANFLDHEICKIDVLQTEVQKAIDLLKERRTALISAAVTGKIDVRSFSTPPAR